MRSDKKLRRAIEKELHSDPMIEALSIAVDVTDGIARLSGQVSSFDQKYRLYDVAKRVRGLAGLVVEVGIKKLDLDEDSNVQTRHELRNAPI